MEEETQTTGLPFTVKPITAQRSEILDIMMKARIEAAEAKKAAEEEARMVAQWELVKKIGIALAGGIVIGVLFSKGLAYYKDGTTGGEPAVHDV